MAVSRSATDEQPQLRPRRGLAEDPVRFARSFELGRFVSAPYEDATFDVSAPATLWQSPSQGATWDFRLHGLLWVMSLLEAAAQTDDDELRGARERLAEVYARSWVAGPGADEPGEQASWQPHQTALRAQVLAWGHLRLAWDWTEEPLRKHAAYLSDPARFSGAWNHGVDEVLALVWVAMALDDDDCRQTGVRRAREIAAELVDAEGVTNEQAVGYQEYSFSILFRLSKALDVVGAPQAELQAPLSRMGRLMLHAVQPDGRWTPLGDTNGRPTTDPLTLADREALRFVATGGAKGTRPVEEGAVFSRGFAFARSGWGDADSFDEQSHLSVRFGEGRRLHGHRDHTALTYFDHRPLLVEAGFSGYEDPARRAYERSEQAHNQVLMTGQGPYRWADECAMVQHGSGGSGLDVSYAYVLEDQPYEGVRRRRSILLLPRRGLLLVVDRVRSARPGTATQVWHLAPDLRVDVRDGAGRRVVAKDGQGTLQMRQLAPVGSTTVLRGDAELRGGWYARGLGESVPAATLHAVKKGSDVTFVTLFASRGPVRARWWGGVGLLLGDGARHVVRTRPEGLLTARRVRGRS